MTGQSLAIDWAPLARETLSATGLRRHRILRFWNDTALVAVAILVAVCAIALRILLPGHNPLLDALVSIGTLIGLTLSYIQWRAARHEASFDKYYDKLGTANEAFNIWRQRVLQESEAALQDHLNTMFVFAELDNLEYVLEKYRLAYVKEELAKRALLAFISRCAGDDDFSTRALCWVGKEEGDQQAHGYHRTTREAVRHVVYEVRSVRIQRPVGQPHERSLR